MIRMLHTADCHLDAPLRNFTDLQRRELRASLLELPGKIADLSIREGCDIAVLSGGIFDGPGSRESYEAVYRCLERMEIPVFIVPGGTDPYREDSIWAREEWPDNVFLFKSDAPSSFSIRELDCRIYGAACPGPEGSGLPEEFRAECDERHVLLALWADPGDPDTAARIRDAGVDYAALGGSRDRVRLEAGGALCAWPGSPMGRDFTEPGTRGVLIAELGEGVRLRFEALEGPRFYSYSVDAMSDPLGAVTAVLPEGGSTDHFRVRVTGRVRPEVMDRLPEHLSLWPNLTILDKTTPQEDLWAGAGEDTLTGLFFRNLRDAVQAADPAEAELQELAARISRRLLAGEEVELP